MSRKNRNQALARNGQPPATAGLSMQSASIQYSGPLPPPSMLEKYEQIVPGSAAQMMQQAAGQAAHRQDLERMVIHADIKRASQGLWAGIVVSMAGLFVSALLAMTDHEPAAIAVAAIDLGGLATTFVVGTVSRQLERRAKIKTMLAMQQGREAP